MERAGSDGHSLAQIRVSSSRAEARGEHQKKLDLTGRQYGKLTVLSPAEKVGGKTAWLCRCSCGRETVVKTSRLRSGRTVSCGCLAAGRGPGKNLPGLTYVDGTCVEMLAAKTVRKNNTSGVPSVDWWASKQRWRATICFQGKRHYLGSYTRFEDAVAARKRAEETFHDSFLREFARREGGRPAPPQSRRVLAADGGAGEIERKGLNPLLNGGAGSGAGNSDAGND